jgi:hypothetical protein
VAAPIATTRDVAGRTSDKTRPPSSRGSDKCHRSGKNGHWARECRSKPKCEEWAHVAEDDEPTLIMAHSVGITSFEIMCPQATAVPPLSLLITVSTSRRCVELVEEEVFTMVGHAGSSDPKCWIFDTGASNHMTEIKEVFLDFDTGVNRHGEIQ